MERTSDFVSTMALTIEPLTDGTAITMKVLSRYKWLGHWKMRARAHHRVKIMEDVRH